MYPPIQLAPESNLQKKEAGQSFSDVYINGWTLTQSKV